MAVDKACSQEPVKGQLALLREVELPARLGDRGGEEIGYGGTKAGKRERTSIHARTRR